MFPSQMSEICNLCQYLLTFHAVPNFFDFIPSTEHKEDILKEFSAVFGVQHFQASEQI